MLDFVAHFRKLSRTQTQTDPKVPDWTQPVLRADGESAHETSGIHQAEDIDEDRTLIGSSNGTKPKMNLRAGCHPEEGNKVLTQLSRLLNNHSAGWVPL